MGQPDAPRLGELHPPSIDFASFLSFAALVPLFALSVYLFLSDSRNITLLLTCLYLATAIVKE